MEQRILLPKEDAVRRKTRAQKIATYLASLDPEKPWELRVLPHIPTRSLTQNAYLWSIYTFILKRGGEELGGWTKDDLHEFFLIEAFGGETRELFGRKRIKPLKRSSRLNKQDFSDLIETICRFMAQRGLYIPAPEEDWEQVA